jgi:hypothetical protein
MSDQYDADVEHCIYHGVAIPPFLDFFRLPGACGVGVVYRIKTSYVCQYYGNLHAICIHNTVSSGSVKAISGMRI